MGKWKWEKRLNVLWPLNMAAIYFGGKWVLSLLGLSVGWGDYTLACLVTLLIAFVASIHYTITWR